MSVVTDLSIECRRQDGGKDVSAYTFDRKLVVALRIFLVNLNFDEPQENFFLEMLDASKPSITLESYYVQHLKEYLQGATR